MGSSESKTAPKDAPRFSRFPVTEENVAFEDARLFLAVKDCITTTTIPGIPLSLKINLGNRKYSIHSSQTGGHMQWGDGIWLKSSPVRNSLVLTICTRNGGKGAIAHSEIPILFFVKQTAPFLFWCVMHQNDNPASEIIAELLMEAILKPGDETSILYEDFELIKTVGKGSFGKVFLVKERDTRKLYAMKTMEKGFVVEKQKVSHVLTERKILDSFSHPFISLYYCSFQTNEKLYVITEFLPGGELFFHLKQAGCFEEERVRFYSAEISLALNFLHSNRVIYRDLKPENLLLDEHGHIRLTDFGLSKILDSGVLSTKTFCGTSEYLAPEILKSEQYSTAVDWWSLGVLIFEMFTGLPPFYDENRRVMYDRILYGSVNFPTEVPRDARKLIEGLLSRNPEERLGYKSTDPGGITEIKRAAFFSRIDWDRLASKEVEPPFSPKLKGATDLSFFERAITSEPPVDKSAPWDAGSIPEDLFRDFAVPRK